MGTLYLVATPIGNLADISIRAIQTLFSVDMVASEDTRRTGILLSELAKRFGTLVATSAESHMPKLLRYDDRSEQTATPEILEALGRGLSVALVSDAGTPLISDPGYILVREARKHGAHIVSVPGASAVLTALASSGLPANTFMFLGYPPEKQGKRIKLFISLHALTDIEESTYIFYCAPHKLLSTLADLEQALGDIEVVITRELTKVHEEYWHGRCSQARTYFNDPKGEFVLLVHLPGSVNAK